MDIILERCNNIDFGKIEIKEQALNIKYAINGTGKSTIVKSIQCATLSANTGRDHLSTLTPFKFRSSNERPAVSGIEQISSVKIFDEKYINDFAFQADELVKGSFEIFIKGPDYEQGIAEINALIEVIKNQLSQDPELDELIDDFGAISSSFGKEVKAGIHASSALAKAFKGGNKVKNIPAELELYKDFIQHSENYRWLKWQQDGKSYLDISCHCPFCTTEIEQKKSIIHKVSEVYEPKSVENLNKIVSTFEKLERYFSEPTKNKVSEFVRCIEGYTKDQIEYLLEIKSQIERLRKLFIDAKTLNFNSFKDFNKAIDAVSNLKIDLDLFTHLQSEETRQKVSIVNNSADQVIKDAGRLQGCIRKQQILIEKLVQKHSVAINNFLKNAGYSYQVTLAEDQSNQHKLKLIHNDLFGEISDVQSHLSYGEKNAFALILFMFHALKDKPDLIVLDDPISSFDKNKKYAIIDMLFRKEDAFKNKTVLLLTHDLDPIIDMVYHHGDRFSAPFVTFIENRHGQLSEKPIDRDCIKTFIEVCKSNLSDKINDISKLVYLRRTLEITGDNSAAFQVISNLLHKRDALVFKSGDISRPLSTDEYNAGCVYISGHISSFDYKQLLKVVCDNKALAQIYANCTSNYEKLHIYRIMFDGKAREIESDVIQKFINEAFHVENNYIYQLNPCDFQLVPQYVIDECDSYVSKISYETKGADLFSGQFKEAHD
nr:AAA family ATPase [Stutzerimonas stutzeri]